MTVRILLEDTAICVDDLLHFILEARLVGDTRKMPITARGRECTALKLVARKDGLIELDIEDALTGKQFATSHPLSGCAGT